MADSRPVLILGAKGMLGQELVRAYADVDVVGWDREDCDVTSEACETQIRELNPSVIVNAVAYNAVDAVEDGSGREAAQALNVEVPKRLAALAKEIDATIVHFGSDYVFDGERGGYSEEDETHPVNVYGQTKHDGELAVLSSGARAYVVRLAWLFGRPASSEHGKKSFVDLMLALAETRDHLDIVNDEASSPTYARDLAEAVRHIVETQEPGLYHAANSGSCTWYEFAQEIFAAAGVSIETAPVSGAAFPRPAKRPKNGSLISVKLPPQRPWQEALRDYLQDRSDS